MDSGLLLEIGTILSIAAIVIPLLAACGVFKSRRQRELDAQLKNALRQGARKGFQRPSPSTAIPSPLNSVLEEASAQADAFDPRLRSRSKAFDSSSGTAPGVDLHSTRRTQRRYRRTSCILRSHAKGCCPRCGSLF